MVNSFGKTSVLNLTIDSKTTTTNCQTYLSDVYFTAPFKIAKPFILEDNSIKIVVMSASAGIMSGDKHEININVLQNTKSEVTSQSYEKIHKMDDGKAVRACNINVDENALFVYSPLPTIPFEDSAFESFTNVYLKSKSSKFILSEILCCGRLARDEKFKYKYYNTNLNVYCRDNLIIRDNLNLNPSYNDLESFGFFENNTHLASMLVTNFNVTHETLAAIREIIDANNLDGGATFLWDKSVCIRIFANNAQILSKISEEIINIVK